MGLAVVGHLVVLEERRFAQLQWGSGSVAINSRFKKMLCGWQPEAYFAPEICPFQRRAVRKSRW